MAAEFVEKFFAGKSWFCGGPVPKKQLLDQKSLDLVIGTEFCYGIELIYKTFKENNLLQEKHKDIKFVINAINETKKKSVPKLFQAGMILLYLKFSKGLTLTENEFDITHLKALCEEEI